MTGPDRLIITDMWYQWIIPVNEAAAEWHPHPPHSHPSENVNKINIPSIWNSFCGETYIALKFTFLHHCSCKFTLVKLFCEQNWEMRSLGSGLQVQFKGQGKTLRAPGSFRVCNFKRNFMSIKQNTIHSAISVESGRQVSMLSLSTDSAWLLLAEVPGSVDLPGSVLPEDSEGVAGPKCFNFMCFTTFRCSLKVSEQRLQEKGFKSVWTSM